MFFAENTCYFLRCLLNTYIESQLKKKKTDTLTDKLSEVDEERRRGSQHLRHTKLNREAEGREAIAARRCTRKHLARRARIAAEIYNVDSAADDSARGGALMRQRSETSNSRRIEAASTTWGTSRRVSKNNHAIRMRRPITPRVISSVLTPRLRQLRARFSYTTVEPLRDVTGG